MNKICLSVLAVAGLILAVSPAAAQVTQTGTLVGTVVDETGGALPGVTIGISGPKMITQNLKVHSNAQGSFRIPAVPPGKGYTVTAELSGFQTVFKSEIWVRVGQATKVNFILTLAPIEASITVLGEAALVDVEKTDLGENLDGDFIKNLPSTRSYQNLVLLIPGVADDPNSDSGGNWNVHGGSVRDNAYLIDGVNTTDPSTGTFATNFNFDAIEEMEIKTGGYEAEFGQATGAVVNIVTKSGGNDFSGEFNVFGITDGLNSEVVDTETGEPTGEKLIYEEVEPSFNLGGPIKRDKIWFFASYAYTYQNRTFNENQSIPRHWRGHLFNLKGTWQMNEENKFVLQFQGDPTQITNLSQNEYITEDAQPRQDQAGKFINTQWQSIINQNTLFNMQAAFRRDHLDYTNRDKDLDSTNYTNRVWDPERNGYVTYSYGNVGNFQLNTRDRLQINSSLSYYESELWGTHDFKFGGEGEYSADSFDSGIPGGVRYQYQSSDNFRKTESNRTVEENRLTRLSAYAQDSWSPTPGLTMNIGFRFDTTAVDNEVEQLWRWTNVAPRLGFAWDLFNNGKNVVRGNYSRFYFPIITQYAAGFSTEYSISTVYDWDADAGEWIFRNRTGTPNSTALQPDLSAPYTDEFSIGYEREIIRDVALGANVIYRRSQNFVEDRETNMGWDGLGGNTGSGEFINDGGMDGTGDFNYSVNNIPGVTKYRALEITARKNFSNNWQMLASYVLSKGEGDVMGDYIGSSSISNEWDTPSVSGDGFGPYGTNQYGLLNFDQRHVFRFSGTYFFPYGFNAGVTYSFTSGTPYNHFFYHDGSAAFLILRDPRGQFHYDSRNRLDFRVEKAFELPWGNLGFLFDIFNLFNDTTVTEVREFGEWIGPEWNDTDDWTRFEEVLTRVAPRRVQLGIRFTF